MNQGCFILGIEKVGQTFLSVQLLPGDCNGQCADRNVRATLSICETLPTRTKQARP